MAYVPIKYLRVRYINTTGTPTEMLVTNMTVKKGSESVADFTDGMHLTYSKAIEKALKNVRWSNDVHFEVRINQTPDHLGDFIAIYTDGLSINVSKATIQNVDVPETQKGEPINKVYSFSYYANCETNYFVTNKVGSAKELTLPGLTLKTHQVYLVVAQDAPQIIEHIIKQLEKPPQIGQI